MIFHREFGNADGPCIVIAHGLCGSSRNWLGICDGLAAKGFRVLAIDARGHGQSPWAGEISYQTLAQDFFEWLGDKTFTDFYFLGHSMGGKLGMTLATKHLAVLKNRLRGIVVADIAPKEYHPHYQDALRACLELPLKQIENRKHSDALLAEKIPNAHFRQFLLSNLYQTPEGWRWYCDFASILRDLPKLAKNPLNQGDISNIPALFLAGTNSEFISPNDETLIKKHFPLATLDWISAGHNLHIEQPAHFIELVENFLKTHARP